MLRDVIAGKMVVVLESGAVREYFWIAIVPRIGSESEGDRVAVVGLSVIGLEEAAVDEMEEEGLRSGFGETGWQLRLENWKPER